MKYAAALEPIAIHYWGEPNRILSKPGKELRFGTHGSKVADLTKGVWFDHELDAGGGVTDLIKLNEPNVNVADRMASFGLPKSEASTRTETVWNYMNEDGEVVYQVVRIDDKNGKTYRQRHIDQDTGEITWGMQGVTALPYNLPALRSSTKPVFIVEGEKCADALIERGLLATTNHGGAGKFWPSIVPYFEARNVIIVPDNDAPGEKHARIIANSLTGIAKSIRILRLPFLKQKGDVADWLEAGGTKEEFTDLANQAPLYDPLTAPLPPAEPIAMALKPRIQIVDWKDIEEVKVKWLVDGMIPSRGFCALYGKPGSYKSFVALYLAAMIATGKEAFGRTTDQGDVVYLMGEGGSGLKPRRDALIRQYGLEEDVKIHFIRAQLNLRSTDEDAKALIAAIQDRSIKCKVLIIDTLARAFGGGNENASEDMGAFISQLGKIQDELKTSIIVVHHSGKNEAMGMRGHSNLLGAVDAELEVVKISDDDNPNRVGQMTITKQKDGEDGVKIGYRMESIQLSPIDPDKRSLVVVPVDASEVGPRKRRLTAAQQLVMEALTMAVAESGALSGLPNIPPQAKTVSLELWRQTYYSMTTAESEARRKAFQRASAELVRYKMAGIWSDRAWIVEQDHGVTS
ncbi:MAG: hypothetical protein EB015_05785 [Methylocystaceae bacterium]|nr:hypothetical protein [Methylocystaceae bacterium]